MEANIATMTQAEKVLLRYNYVLAQTGMAQGDFQRTQGTWANQIRILRQQFEALGAIIGQNFVYALKPVVTALNTVMAKLIQFARVVSNSLGKIFGWKYDDTIGGVTNELEFGAEAADDLGSGLGGAADKAKKLKQQLQGFDELKVLTTNTPSSGGGGGGGALGDTDTSATGGQWVPDNEEKFFESNLDTLYKLGDHIGTTITNQLRSIDWNKVYQGAKNFGSGLASFLNGLISVDLFSATGATIAGALNTAIYSALSFGVTFDFEEFGLSVIEGVNTFFRDTDFKSLGKTINVWISGLVGALITALDNADWNAFANSLGDFFEGLDIPDLASKLAKLAGKIISSLGTALKTSFETAPLETALVLLFGGLKLAGIGTALSGALGTALGSGLTLNISKIVATVTTLSILANQAETRFTEDGGENLQNVGFTAGAGFVGAKALGASNSLALGIGSILGTAKAGSEVGLALGESIAIGLGDWELADYYADFKWSDLFDYSPKEYGQAFADMFGGKSFAAKSGLDEGKKALKDFSDNAKKYFGKASGSYNDYVDDFKDGTKSNSEDSLSFYENFYTNAESFNEKLKTNSTGVYDDIKEHGGQAFQTLANKVTFQARAMSAEIANKFGNANNSIKISSSDTTSDIVAKYKAMRTSVVNTSTSMGSSLKSISDGIKTKFNADTNNIKTTSASANSNIVSKYKSMKESVSSIAENMRSIVNSKSNNIKDTSAKATSDIVTKYTSMKGNVSSIAEAMKNAVNGSSNSIKNTSAGTTTDITNKYSSMKNSVSSVVEAMRKALGVEFDGIKSSSSNTTSDITAKYSNLKTNNIAQVSMMKSAVVNLFDKLKTDSVSKTSTLDTELKSKFDSTKKGAETSFGGLLTAVTTKMAAATKTVKDEDWHTPGVNLVEGLKKGINNKWNGTGNSGLKGMLVSLAQSLTNSLKNAFGIHSPSRLWRDDIGFYLAEGLRLGVVDEEGHITRDIIGMGNRLTNSFSGALTLATPSSLSGNYDFGVTSTMAHQFSADTSMTSNIADGVRQGLSSSQAEQNALLREQNELLMQILEKTGISSSDLFNAVRRESRQHYNQTGTSAFVY